MAASTATLSAASLAETVVLNVGGTRFETTVKTLLAVRGSRLEAVAKSGAEHASYRRRQGDYFFDRHPGAFDAVLQFHRTGVLHLGGGICGGLLKQELKYWGIDDALVQQCCWDQYSQSVERSSEFDRIEQHIKGNSYRRDGKRGGMELGDKSGSSAGNGEGCRRPDEASYCRRAATRFWLALNDPAYSKCAAVFFVISAAFTVASIATVIAESHCASESGDRDSQAAVVVAHDNRTVGLGETESSTVTAAAASAERCAYDESLRLADLVMFAYFALEFALRLALAPRRRRYLLAPASIVDLVCLAAQAATTAERYAFFHPGGGDGSSGGEVVHEGFRWLRILQLLRAFKLLRHSVMAKVLMYTVIMSLHELAIVVVFMALFVVLFACLAHYVEGDTFTSISYGCWWSLVTLTTVGYGDVSPRTTAGYAVGSLCALVGVFVVAFTVPVAVSNFNVYYSHVLTRRRWKERCRRAQLTSSLWKELPLIAKSRGESWSVHLGVAPPHHSDVHIG